MSTQLSNTLNSLVKLDQEQAALNARILQSTVQERDAYKKLFQQLIEALKIPSEGFHLKITSVQPASETMPVASTSLEETLSSISLLDKTNAAFTQSILRSTEIERDAYKEGCERLRNKLKEQNAAIAQPPLAVKASGPSLEDLQKMTDRITNNMEAVAQTGASLDPKDRPSVFLNLSFLRAHKAGIKIDAWKNNPPTAIIDTIIKGHPDLTQERILNLTTRKITEIVDKSKNSHEALYSKIQKQQDGDTLVGAKKLEAEIYVEFERFLQELSSNTQSSLVNASFPSLALNLYALWNRLISLQTLYGKIIKDKPSLKAETQPHLDKAQTYLDMIRNVKNSYSNLLESCMKK